MSFNKLLDKTPLDICNIINNYITEIDVSIKYSKVLNDINKISYDENKKLTYSIITFHNKAIMYKKCDHDLLWVSPTSMLNIFTVYKNKKDSYLQIYDYCDVDSIFYFRYIKTS
jgi:hypothetical protein